MKNIEAESIGAVYIYIYISYIYAKWKNKNMPKKQK